MQLVRRHLVPPELDHELIWLTVSFGSLAFAAIWLALGLPWPRCANSLLFRRSGYAEQLRLLRCSFARWAY